MKASKSSKSLEEREIAFQRERAVTMGAIIKTLDGGAIQKFYDKRPNSGLLLNRKSISNLGILALKAWLQGQWDWEDWVYESDEQLADMRDLVTCFGDSILKYGNSEQMLFEIGVNLLKIIR